MGFREAARSAYEAHRLHVKLLRKLRDIDYPENELRHRIEPLPDSIEYWRRGEVKNYDWASGHWLKYPYTYYSLIKLISDRVKVKACEEQLRYII